jgi:hypothetical protein
LVVAGYLGSLGVRIMALDLRAFLAGLAASVATNIIFFALVTLGWSDSQLFAWAVVAVGYAAPLLGGFVYGYLVQEDHFVALLVLGIASAVCAGSLNFVLGELGFPVDMVGLGNLPWVIGLSLLAIVPLVVIGGAVGAELHRGARA